MGFNIMHVFETSLDVVGITLSCVIVSYLIYNRIKYNQMLLSRKYKNNISSFNSQVAVKMIKQQTERSFDTIYDMINKERRKFKRLMEKEELKNGKNLMLMEKGHLLEKVINTKAMGEVQGEISSYPYDEILRLAGAGLGAQKISNKVGVPREEVELYLKLNKDYTFRNSYSKCGWQLVSEC
ncbi:MAG: hypothetical protein JRI92_11720 [Deltaproteobacteria bacterium]|nr:hypothetical protein [Deltaproteobacteria bacterium]